MGVWLVFFMVILIGLCSSIWVILWILLGKVVENSSVW